MGFQLPFPAGSVLGAMLAAGAVTPDKQTPSYFHNAITADVVLNNMTTFFTGPIVSQGAGGIWLVVGKVTVGDTSGLVGMTARITDGVTVFDRAYTVTHGTYSVQLNVAAIVVNPVGDIRITVRDGNGVAGIMMAAVGAETGVSSITAVRIG